MSSFAKKANWADVGSSDDEEEPEKEKMASIHNNDDDEDEEEENEEHDEDAMTATKSVATNAQTKEKEIQVLQLSKKERKELRERELSDLDSLLAEFFRAPNEQIEPHIVSIISILQENEEQEDAIQQCDEKKKKKKKPANRRGQNCENVANENGDSNLHEDCPGSTVPIADLATVLKAKVIKSKKSSATDIKKLAVAEALKVSNSTDAKKKKKDKKGFNETSY